MRDWRTLMVLAALSVPLGQAHANNLRGQIRQLSPVGSSGWLPAGGVTVHLTKESPKGLMPVDETQSTSDGYYFFFKVAPGDYVLAVDGKTPAQLQFRLHVAEGTEQDVAPIVMQ